MMIDRYEELVEEIQRLRDCFQCKEADSLQNKLNQLERMENTSPLSKEYRKDKYG